MSLVAFTEESIQKLFGHEAAEDEDPRRLQEYYFKTDIFDRIVADVPLRILVGHKGTGKSALLKMCIEDDRQKGRLSVTVQPNEIASLGTDTADFLQTVKSWHDGVMDLVCRKALSRLALKPAASVGPLDGSISKWIVEQIRSQQAKEAPDKSQEEFKDKFIKHPEIRVYLDDLDRGWQGRRTDITRISALLNAVRDMSNNDRGLKFRLALRSDVFYLVRTSDESTDKIEQSVVWHTWSNHDIFVLLVKRILTFRGIDFNEDDLKNKHQKELAKYTHGIIEERFSGKGHWENAPMHRVLMSLIRKRPRDLVKLCTLAAHRAQRDKRNMIVTADFQNIFEEYSLGRVQDTINEFRSELPTIERLLMGMKPSKLERKAKEGYVYTTDQLVRKIQNIMETGAFIFASQKQAGAKELAEFLYKINFLTARKEKSDGIVRKYFEENRALGGQFADFGFAWEVHPAYRWALQPDDVTSIFRQLELTVENE